MVSFPNPEITRLLLEFDPRLTVAPQLQERLLELVYATQVDLADVLLREGDPAGARALLLEAVPILEKVFGADFELCRRARDLLARSA